MQTSSIIIEPNSVVAPLHLDILRITDPFIIKNCILQCNSAEFVYGHDALDGLMLYKDAIHFTHGGKITINICDQCYKSLAKDKVPKFALANGLYRGQLPSQFADLTWVEEMVCARYRYTAHITCLFQSSDPTLPNVMHGNTCAHEMNVVSTAHILPRTPADVNDALSVIFIGPGKLHKKFLHTFFRIRKQKVWKFLMWLRSHNKFYSDIPLDQDILDMYPNDGALPGIEDRVVEDHNSDASKIFSEETASLSEHPVDLMKGNDNFDEPFLFLEKMGVSDPEGDRLSGRTFVAAGLCNLVQDKADTTFPDLILHRGSQAIREYKNPDLLPGMYPTLWPFGLGGFEDPGHFVSISFQAQANYYFDLPDRSFRYHHSYAFVVLNILQCHAAHLHTHFTVRKPNFTSVAEKIVNISPEVLLLTAKHLEHEGLYKDLNKEQHEALDLLQKINAVSAHVPGSQASKIYIRNEIRNYFGYFGIPQLYFTANPSAAHSPIFQVMFGDQNVDLSKQFPKLVPSYERAMRLAKDPIAAADFFQFSINCIFQHLFGWDPIHHRSIPEGGILGHIRAYYGTAELTERANFHAHFLIWLEGGLNPSDLHQRLKDDPMFKIRFFDFFKDIIHHHLPDNDIQVNPHYEPWIERPPMPPSSSIATINELYTWESAFVTQIKLCGEVLQCHTCKAVCHKYGNEGHCRFPFPHEIVETSYFDADTDSIVLMCQDSTVNFFNPYFTSVTTSQKWI
jgi:hypothetical protein